MKSKAPLPKVKLDVQGPREKPREKDHQKHAVTTTLFIRGGRKNSTVGDHDKPSTLAELFEDPQKKVEVPKEEPSLFGKMLSFLKFW